MRCCVGVASLLWVLASLAYQARTAYALNMHSPAVRAPALVCACSSLITLRDFDRHCMYATFSHHSHPALPVVMYSSAQKCFAAAEGAADLHCSPHTHLSDRTRAHNHSQFTPHFASLFFLQSGHLVWAGGSPRAPPHSTQVVVTVLLWAPTTVGLGWQPI